MRTKRIRKNKRKSVRKRGGMSSFKNTISSLLRGKPKSAENIYEQQLHDAVTRAYKKYKGSDILIEETGEDNMWIDPLEIIQIGKKYQVDKVSNEIFRLHQMRQKNHISENKYHQINELISLLKTLELYLTNKSNRMVLKSNI